MAWTAEDRRKYATTLYLASPYFTRLGAHCPIHVSRPETGRVRCPTFARWFCQVSRHRPGRRRLVSPENCGGAGHLGSRSSNHRLQFSTAILTGASADRTCGWAKSRKTCVLSSDQRRSVMGCSLLALAVVSATVGPALAQESASISLNLTGQLLAKGEEQNYRETLSAHSVVMGRCHNLTLPCRQ